jgi:ABC-type transport system substrate-binding protein
MVSIVSFVRGSVRARLARVVIGLAVLAIAVAGCGGSRRPALSVVRWSVGHAAPAFDPDGPPDALRIAIERSLSRGLFERDSAGVVRAVAAESAAFAADGRTLTIRLRAGLRFTDGTPATSADFRAALLGGVGRSDHATRAWLLSEVTGMSKLRAGRPLPPLGIEAPDPRTVVIRLASRDTLLLEKLACPGMGVPWRHRAAPGWAGAIGLGPYRVAREVPGRELELVRADAVAPRRARADTIAIRFLLGAPRLRTLLRRGSPDLVWPLPPELLTQEPPKGFAVGRLEARPPRRLLIVLRADVPPTTRLPARHALAHALNREELLAALAALGAHESAGREWLEGAGPYDFPRLDAGEARSWLARGKLGASFHVTLAYDADGAAAEVARTLQGQWARLGLYADLRPLRGPAAAASPLAAATAQVHLVEAAPPLPGAPAQLAAIVMPVRGPAVGSFRSGWRTREFDHWIAGSSPPAGFPAEHAQQRLADERIVLPLAVLPWTWVVRTGATGVRFDPETGVDFTRPAPPRPRSR